MTSSLSNVQLLGVHVDLSLGCFPLSCLFINMKPDLVRSALICLYPAPPQKMNYPDADLDAFHFIDRVNKNEEVI